jgi:hypothetical protein
LCCDQQIPMAKAFTSPEIFTAQLKVAAKAAQ